MAIQTFTSGQILTAADTNTYLANSGLVYVSTTSITSSGQNIANAFSSTYTNYRIICTDFTTSANNALVAFRLGSSTTRTEYAYGSVGMVISTGAISNDNAAAGTYGMIGYTRAVSGGTQNFAFDLMNPQIAGRKTWSCSWNNGTYCGTVSGIDGLGSAQTDINFLVGSGTLTAGTVTIYGYRKA
jgi:hypothetical protein